MSQEKTPSLSLIRSVVACLADVGSFCREWAAVGRIVATVVSQQTAENAGRRLSNLSKGTFVPSGEWHADSHTLGAMFNLSDDSIKLIAKKNNVPTITPGGTFLFQGQNILRTFAPPTDSEMLPIRCPDNPTAKKPRKSQRKM